jgi:uncharacterized Tic20 family protein
MACHLAALSSFATPFALNLAGIAAPLLVWQWRDRADASLRRAAREAANFQLNLLGWWTVFVIVPCCAIGPLGAANALVLATLNVVLTLYAAAAVADGRDFRYPFTFRAIEFAESRGFAPWRRAARAFDALHARH